jgi:hypothetical protein
MFLLAFQKSHYRPALPLFVYSREFQGFSEEFEENSTETKPPNLG